MHRCLLISEILHLILEFVACSEDHVHLGPHLGNRRTLAALARTCHLLCPPALDVLWHDLYSFNPILDLLQITAPMDDTQWPKLTKYVRRVKTIRGRGHTGIKQDYMLYLRHCPEAYLPLLPNLSELEWSEISSAAPQSSSISLLRYFASPTVTSMTHSLVSWPAHSPEELAVLADLPKLCPNVTSLTITLRRSRDYEHIQEVGRMVLEWPKLRNLNTCALPQPIMDQLFSQRALETLRIEYHSSSPRYTGRIPDTVREISLCVNNPLMCADILRDMYASPTKFCLLIDMNEEEKEADFEHMFSLLSRHLDASRLQSFAIRPKLILMGIPWWHTLYLRESAMSALVTLTALRELDLDTLCTAHTRDADYARMAASLRQLRCLKLGTANPSTQARISASVGAVIAVLTHCAYLETFHIVFDGSVPLGSVFKDDGVALPEEGVRREWGVSNRRITRFCVGPSPIGDTTVDPIARCLKSVMPCLVTIEHKSQYKEWNMVQNMLESY